MKLTRERREHVAGAYVLGTLRGPARRWVERRSRHDALLCVEIVTWQDQLARWVEQLAPVAPRDELWLALERRLVSPLAVVTPLPVATPEPLSALLRVPDTAIVSAVEPWLFWRRVAGVALAASLALAIGITVVLRSPAEPTHTAVFADAQGRAIWIVDARLPAGEIDIRALPLALPPPGKSYELWMLPVGGKPVSLGLLPAAGRVELVLHDELPGRLLTAAGMAVSLEPEGGSPTGQPTGPVIYQAVLTRTTG